MRWDDWVEENVRDGVYVAHPRWSTALGFPWALVRDDGLCSPSTADTPFASKQDGLEAFVQAADEHAPVKPETPGPVEVVGWGNIQDLWE